MGVQSRPSITSLVSLAGKGPPREFLQAPILTIDSFGWALSASARTNVSIPLHFLR